MNTPKVYFSEDRKLKRQYPNDCNIHESFNEYPLHQLMFAMDMFPCFHLGTRYLHHIETRGRYRRNQFPFIEEQDNASFTSLHPVAKYDFAPLYLLVVSQSDDWIVRCNSMSGILFRYDRFFDEMHEVDYNYINMCRLVSRYSSYLIAAINETNKGFIINNKITSLFGGCDHG